jgi:hypothetical protein
MSTFLRLELAGRTGDTILLNVDHIVRIHPTWPHGCTIVTTDDTSLNVRASLAALDVRLRTTGGRINVFAVEAPLDNGVDAVYEAARADVLP